MYPWMLWYRVGTSVEPWIAAWPRRAITPPPARLERPHQVVERGAGALRDQVFGDGTRGLRPALIGPGRVVVSTLEPIVRPERRLGKLHHSRKDAVQILGVLEVVADDRRGVGVVDRELLEEGVRVPPLAVDDVVDQAAEEGDVRARADRDVQIGDRAGAGEAGIDVDQLRAVELGLHGPAERHRMALRHVRAHDDEAIGVLEIARIQGRRAATEPCPQTGDARAVSYPGLIFDGDDPEPAPELLAYVVELVVERRATEPEHRGAHVHELPVRELLDERLVAGLLDQLGHAVHGPLELDDFPILRAGFAVQDLGRPVRVEVELVDRRALGAEGALVVRAARIAFDVDDLAVDGVDEGRTPDRAERANARRRLGVLDAQLLRPRHGRCQRHAEPDEPADRGPRSSAGRKLQEIPPTDLHGILPA